MIRYSLGHEMIFFILTLIAALALFNFHLIIALAFSILAIVFICVEDMFYDETRSI